MYTWSIKHDIMQTYAYSDGKEMYKKVSCPCKAVVLLIFNYMHTYLELQSSQKLVRISELEIKS